MKSGSVWVGVIVVGVIGLMVGVVHVTGKKDPNAEDDDDRPRGGRQGSRRPNRGDGS